MSQLRPKISVEYDQNATVVTLADAKILEDGDIQALEKSVMPLISENSGSNFVLDFSVVRFLSSSVLGLLIRISKRVTEAGGKLRLCSIDAKILEVFKITHLDKVFNICDNRKKALRSIEIETTGGSV